MPEDELKLPPMPESGEWNVNGVMVRGFDEPQMTAYAREAVLAERERCAKLCEEMDKGELGEGQPCGFDCAAAIRKGTP